VDRLPDRDSVKTVLYCDNGRLHFLAKSERYWHELCGAKVSHIASLVTNFVSCLMWAN